ncbi:hypothetical protein [Chlorobium limicola]|nr:hypothetical protein [Chlorobium limicola]
MKKKQACHMLLFSVYFLVSGIAVAGQLRLREARGDVRKVYTPAPGSEERTEILDAMRMKVKELHDLDVIFVVKTMTVSKGWAWVHTQPRSRDGSGVYEDFFALLHRRQGRWSIAEIPCTEPENPECMESPGYFRRLAVRFPSLPSVLLPMQSSNCR